MNKKVIRYILACLGLVCNIVALVLFAAPFVSTDIFTVSISGFECVKDALDGFIGVLIALIFTCILLLVSAYITFKAVKNESIMNEKLGKPTLAFCGMLAFITLILQCCTLVLSKTEDVEIFKVGGGAIASGVMAFVGTVASIVSCYSEGWEISKHAEDGIEATKKEVPSRVGTKSIELSKLRELKSLLDDGAITQEEFESMKKVFLDDFYGGSSK